MNCVRIKVKFLRKYYKICRVDKKKKKQKEK